MLHNNPIFSTIKQHYQLAFFSLIWISLCWTTPAQAQDSITKPAIVTPKPRPKSTPLLALNNTAQHNYDIAKTALLSNYPRSFKVQQKPLNRKYYNNNIFDIDESDNPFALPIKGRKSQRQRKRQESNEELISFSDLFESNNNTTGSIPQWLIFILLGILSFMTILLTVFPKTINTIFQGFLTPSAARNIQRDQGNLLRFESFSSYILFVVSMGTFCFLIPQIMIEEYDFNSFAFLALSVLGVIAVYSLKHLQLKILSFILPFPQEVDYYSFAVSNTNKVLGYFLVPILFLLAYVPENAQIIVLYASFVFLGLIYLYRSLKGLAVAGNIILFHKFHFFTYLCAVEIAPILILLKLLSIL